MSTTKSSTKEVPPLNEKNLGEDAEVETIMLKDPPKCNHGGNLVEAAGNQVICTKCNFGLYVGGDDHIVDGHLYYKGKKVI